MEEVKKEITEVIYFHLEGLQIEGLSIPLHICLTDYEEAS